MYSHKTEDGRMAVYKDFEGANANLKEIFEYIENETILDWIFDYLSSEGISFKGEDFEFIVNGVTVRVVRNPYSTHSSHARIALFGS